MKKILVAVLSFALILLASCSEQEISLQNPSCSEYKYDECPDPCVVCPPCPQCSSLRCASEEFCKSIGFEPDWYNSLNST